MCLPSADASDLFFDFRAESSPVPEEIVKCLYNYAFSVNNRLLFVTF